MRGEENLTRTPAREAYPNHAMRVPVQENGENMCSVRRNEKKGHASGQWQSKAQLTITKRQPAPKQVVQQALLA